MHTGLDVISWSQLGLGAAAWVWLLAAYFGGSRLLPRPRRLAVPWKLPDLCLALLFWWILPPQIWFLWRILFERLGQLLMAGDPDAGRSVAWQIVAHVVCSDYQAFVLVVALASLAAAAFMPLLLALTCGARPYQLGLHTWQFGRNVLRGFAGYLLAAPWVILSMAAATYWYEPQAHVIERAIRANPSVEVIALSLVAAVVAAPVAEEVLFRGILQRWLCARVGPAAAIVSTSLAFAALHFDAWPAPVPLFVLALFLGYLAYRTSSLVAPITLHCTFNAVSMCGLLVMVFWA
jgi:membrane protease YdiL (CAAX protease family)